MFSITKLIKQRMFSTKIIPKGTAGSKLIIDYLQLQCCNKIVPSFTGGAILKLTDEFFDHQYFKYIMARTENAASYISNGIAASTGDIAVVMGTSGPGSSHLISGIYNAYTDGHPVLAITANVPTNALGTDAFQEIDSMALTKKITKFQYQPHDVDILNQIMYLAFKSMLSNRTGPAHIDVPKDILSAKTTKDLIITKYEKPTDLYSLYNEKNKIFENLYSYTKTKINPYLKKRALIQKKENYKKYYEILDLLVTKKKPLLLLGAGAFDASKEVDEFLKLTNLPVTTTLHGLNLVDESDELSLSMLGMHGSVSANNAMQSCDLLINIGARLDDRITGNIDLFNPSKSDCKIINFEIDDQQQKRKDKLFKPEINLMGNCKFHLEVINDKLKNKEIPQFEEWKKYLLNLKEKYPFQYTIPTNNFQVRGQQIITELQKVINNLDKDVKLFSGTGNHQFALAQFYSFGNRQKGEKIHITSGSAGDMNFSLNACLGGALANPDKLCISIEGDASHNMTMNSLISFADYNVKNAKLIIFNDFEQSMVSTWQTIFMSGRIISTRHNNPDYVKVAEAHGIKGFLIDNQVTLYDTLYQALEYDGPCLIDCRIIKNGVMSSLVPPGKALDEQILNFECDPNKTIDMDNIDAPC